MRTKGETHVPEGFQVTAATREKIARKYPQVDIETSVENFVEDCSAKGRLYKDWQAGFCSFVRIAVERSLYTVIKLKNDRDHDPRWSIIHVARKEGFRDPELCETPHSYETALRQWRTQPRSNVVDFAKAVRRV